MFLVIKKVILIILVASCSSAPKRKIPIESNLKLRETADEPFEKKLKSRSKNVARSEKCLKALKNFRKPYASLYKNLNLKEEPATPAAAFARLPKDACISQPLKAMKLLTMALSQHNQKIGILLPLSGTYESLGKDILRGMEVALKESGHMQRIIVRDTMGQADQTKHHLAELVFKHEVSAVIGGLLGGEADELAKWSSPLKIATLLLTTKTIPTKRDHHLFCMYPRVEKLAANLAEAAKLHAYRKVALLVPQSQSNSRFVAAFRSELEKREISVTSDLSYISGDFRSMEQTAKQTFKVSTNQRPGEYRRLLAKKKREAREAGVRFNSRLVSLKPIKNFDALFLPDHFKNVRHFVKLFKYLGVKKLPLIGSYTWRSKGLIFPYDKFLNGSFFADFIGRYDELPKVLSIRSINNSFFVPPKTAKQFDLNLIGYRAIKLSLKPVLTTPKRRLIKQAFVDHRTETTPYFSRAKNFDRQHISYWPSYILKVQSGSLQIYGKDLTKETFKVSVK